MLKKGFVKIDRKILDWQWYKNGHTARVFLHLLFTANYEDCKFEGDIIKRGSVATSIGSISRELRISNQSVRTAIQHLKTTGEITSKSTSKYTVFTVINYENYQSNQQTEQQTTNKQPTNEQQTVNNNERKIKKDKKDKKDKEGDKPTFHKYGEFKHVLLSDEQYSSLIRNFGESKTKEYIKRADEYCEQYGKSYKNYSLTIRKWINKDGERNGNNKNHEESKGNSFADLYAKDDI